MHALCVSMQQLKDKCSSIFVPKTLMKGVVLYYTAVSEEGMPSVLSHRAADRKHLSYNVAPDYRIV